MTDLKSIGFSSHRKASSYAGGLQKFDICGVKKRKSPIREPLKVTRKGDFIERLGKPKAYSVGMQIPHCVYPEIPEESRMAPYGNVWGVC